MAKLIFNQNTHMKKLLLPLLLLGAFSAATAQTAAPAGSGQVANPSGPQMKFEHLEYNFGNIKQGESVTHEFVFKNSGKEPLIISSAAGSCGCTVPDWPKDPIKPGGSGRIKVTFNSAGKLNQQDKTVTIVSNATEGTMTLHMKGNVEAKPAETVPADSKGAAAGGTTTAAPAPAKDKAAPTTTAPKTVTATPKAASPKTVPADKAAPKTESPK